MSTKMNNILRKIVKNTIKVLSGRYPIYLDYQVNNRRRYNENDGPHEGLVKLLNLSKDNSNKIFSDLHKYQSFFRNIPVHASPEVKAPYWQNGWVMGMDPVALYGIPVIFESKIYLEIGSGNSTKFVRRAVDDGISSARIISIDPHPRAEIDSICDEVIRSPLEDVDLTIFSRLESNDVLMIDNSHRCFQNSDVTVVFLDILPNLKPGVIIYIDDIYLPFDYPETWKDRYYSEQYMLATLLLNDQGRRYETLFAAQFAAHDEELRSAVDSFWSELGLDGARGYGNGFWMRVRG